MLENEDVGAIKEGDVGVVCKDLKKKRTLEAKMDLQVHSWSIGGHGGS